MNEEKTFDYWMNLFKDNPTEFNKQRNEAIHDAVMRWQEDPDKQKQMEAKIFNMNLRLDRIHDSTERFNKVQSIFWTQFYAFQYELQVFSGEIRSNVEQSRLRIVVDNTKQ
jgi:hypothetical protein